MKILDEKTLLTHPVPRILEKIQIKNDKFLFSRLFAVPQKSFIFQAFILRKVWGTKKKCENKKTISFSPFFLGWDQGWNCVFVKLLTYAISIFLTIEMHKSNIDTSRVTNKQHYKTILF